MFRDEADMYKMKASLLFTTWGGSRKGLTLELRKDTPAHLVVLVGSGSPFRKDLLVGMVSLYGLEGLRV